MSISTLIKGDFGAGAVLITYGVVLGTVSPFQMLIVSILETIFFCVNEQIAFHMKITDLGGSMVIHMFGAFFGLALSMMVVPKAAKGNPQNSAVYHSDMFAMIGTVFLWMFWPSFNGAFGQGNTQHRAVVNTVLALAGSCVAAFLLSHVLRREGKFNMVDIQNATLAGGVAMGTSADLIVRPGWAILVGAVGGAVSVIGYVYVQELLESKLGLHDTCGVNNLHGMPSIVGAISGIILSRTAYLEDYGEQLGVMFGERAKNRTANEQAIAQTAYMFITIGMAVAGGALTGLVAKLKIFEPLEDDDLFQDHKHWEVPELEVPYYFDHRGEVARDPYSGAVTVGDKKDEKRKDATKKNEKTDFQKVRDLESRMTLMEARLQQAAMGGAQQSGGLSSVLKKLLYRIDNRYKQV
jgi:ammonium transporter Rh